MNETSPIRVAAISSIALLAFFLCLAASIGGAYFVGVQAARNAIHAEQTAQQGKSKALCGALKQLATTHDAHLLHRDFAHLYATSGCSAITGLAS